MSSVVKAEKITKTYTGKGIPVTAVNEFSLEVQEGDFIAIAGPSGSGKTTILNMIGTLDNPSSGKVFIGNEDASTLPQKKLAELRLQNIGFIFQSYNLIPVLTCQENTEFVLLLQGVPAAERQKRVNEILEIVGLGGMNNRFPRELSGGQQQRVAVARAIVSKPKLVLADEPTANLDSKTGQALIDLMLQLNKEHNVTFLFSTHDSMVMDAAKKLIRLKDGEIEKIEEH
ncbi:ABC transporter ATP-binding protein [Candidatus Uabimicrobium amorphum]|uniref:ABC transporter ATP-binding protein n=1 Tax=Uabimicrobium amorphum TaxID=2596890 RepID=A0A5S9II75_UABAM|nr:ABC transporter ATP-binding protein [Candidatus Uabimicrobium amorphum]BBM82289.1 ABC transporter ATP-binding protein [Candidatus Uabimicrobium amorphum]